EPAGTDGPAGSGEQLEGTCVGRFVDETGPVPLIPLVVDVDPVDRLVSEPVQQCEVPGGVDQLRSGDVVPVALVPFAGKDGDSSSRTVRPRDECVRSCADVGDPLARTDVGGR